MSQERINSFESEKITVSRRMFTTSRDWPRWPLLPIKQIKHPGDGFGLPKLGYLLSDDNFANGVLRVREGNVFDPHPETDPIIETANSADDLIQKGWIVD